MHRAWDHLFPFIAGTRDPFFRPLDKRDAVDEIRKQLGGEGSCSDHLVLANVFDGWMEAKRAGGCQKFRGEGVKSFQILKLFRGAMRTMTDCNPKTFQDFPEIIWEGGGVLDAISGFKTQKHANSAAKTRLALTGGRIWDNFIADSLFPQQIRTF